ncbi:MAG: class II aldolase/adducin family protein [Alphaproteobacteria bacterium]
MTHMRHIIDAAKNTPYPDEATLRVDLAVAFRLAADFGWTESVGNHFSAALSPDDGRFLMNPRWQLFSTIRASDLLLLNWHQDDTMSRPNPPDRSGWCIHSQIHAELPHARVVLHIHPPYATALSGLKDPTLKPIGQVTARFHDRVSVDLGFEEVATNEREGRRLASLIGDNSVLMMGNHGVTVAAESVAHAFEELYLFERACRTMVLAYGSGQPLNVLPDHVAAGTSRGWDGCRDMAISHFEQLKHTLIKADPGVTD